jgi:hypothetical protein
MWKGLMIIALACAITEWFLFGIDMSINGNFNWVVFPQAVLWGVWAIICLVKFNRYYKQK